ncbi:hypothetical protein [Paenibacillus piscarius]|uniref:hypothetical protein n=1 Tax=Paenibacillus piscarius TaxID=1089681 RepID=UPI001EE8CD8A|nr:hypothetical protein [Paenibacillus piscarius]
MLMILVYVFGVLGVSCLLSAAVLQYRLSRSGKAGGGEAALALSAFSLKFPQRFITPDKSHLIALDEDGQTLAIGQLHPGQPEPATAAVYRFDTILGAELVENALTLSKVSKTSRIITSPPRMRQNTGMAPASADVVPVNANAEEVSELTLKIYLNSEETPVVSIPFLPRVQPARRTDLHYSAALMEAHQVQERIRSIVSA